MIETYYNKCFILVDKNDMIIASSVDKERVKASKELRQDLYGKLRIRKIKREDYHPTMFESLLVASTDLVSFEDDIVLTLDEEDDFIQYLNDYEVNMFELGSQVTHVLETLKWTEDETIVMSRMHAYIQSMMYTMEVAGETSHYEDVVYQHFRLKDLYYAFLQRELKEKAGESEDDDATIW